MNFHTVFKSCVQLLNSEIIVREQREGANLSAHPYYKTDEAFVASGEQTKNDFTHHMGLGKYIQCEELDKTTASTPAIFRSAIHGAISYTLSEWQNPFMLGCGFAVNWMQDNTSPVGYTLWAKAGVTF